MGYKLGHSREKVEKASKGLGKASTSAFKKKGNSTYCPKMGKSKL